MIGGLTRRDRLEMIESVLGDLLSAGIGIALSPIPVIALILMLLSARATRTAPAFAAGWVLGVVVATIVMMLIAPEPSDDGGSTSSGIVRLALGLLFLVMAFGQWRKRPKPGEEAELPKWMAAIDTMPPGRAFGLGTLLAAANPKNLTLAITAALAIVQSGASAGGKTAGVIIFVLIATCSVVGPVVAYLTMRERSAPALGRAKDWLRQNNATVMFVVLLIFGATLVGKAIGDLSA